MVEKYVGSSKFISFIIIIMIFLSSFMTFVKFKYSGKSSQIELFSKIKGGKYFHSTVSRVLNLLLTFYTVPFRHDSSYHYLF